MIGYDNFIGNLLCTIDRKVVSAESLSELLTYIANLFDHTLSCLVYSDMEYMEVLERDIRITFRFGK